jgi:hypothetical protein
MAETKITYGTTTDLILTAAATLASSATAGAESTAVDNSSTLFDDAMVYLSFVIPNSGTIGGDLCFYVYAYGSEDGTNYEDIVTGSTAAITLKSEANLHFLGTIPALAINQTLKKVFGSVAMAFGGTLPRKWGIYVRNYCNVAPTSEVSSFTGITYTTA